MRGQREGQRGREAEGEKREGNADRCVNANRGECEQVRTMGWQVWVVKRMGTSAGDEGKRGGRTRENEAREAFSVSLSCQRVCMVVCVGLLVGALSANAVGTLQNTEVAEITQLCAAKLRRIGLQSRTSPIASPAAVLERRTAASC